NAAVIIQQHLVSISPAAGERKRCRIQVMRVDQSNGFLPREAIDRAVKAKHCGPMEDLVWNFAVECFFKLDRISFENKKEWIQVILPIECVQLTQHSGSIAAGLGQITVRQNEVQGLFPLWTRSSLRPISRSEWNPPWNSNPIGRIGRQ